MDMDMDMDMTGGGNRGSSSARSDAAKKLTRTTREEDITSDQLSQPPRSKRRKDLVQRTHDDVGGAKADDGIPSAIIPSSTEAGKIGKLSTVEAVEKSWLCPTTCVDTDEQERLGDDVDDEEIKAIALDFDRCIQVLMNMKKKAIEDVKKRKMEVKEARQAKGSSDKSSADTYDAGVKNASTLGIVGGVTLLSEPPADCDPPLIPCIPSSYPDVNSSVYSPVPKSFQPITVTGFSKFPSYMIRSVEAALLRYNQKNGGPVLKLIEITCFRGTVKRVDGSTTVHHINFLAQSGNDPSGMVLFFAEGFHAIYNGTYAIGLCCPLNNEAGNRNCGFCRAYTSEQIKHPPGGFYAAVDLDIEAPPGRILSSIPDI